MTSLDPSRPTATNPPHWAFITPRFSVQGTIGGAETLIKQLALHAVQAGQRVSLLTTCAEDHFTWANTLPPGRETVDGLEVHRFPVDEDRDLDAFYRAQDAISTGRQVDADTENDWMCNNVNSTALCEHLHTQGATYDRILAGPYLFSLIGRAALVHPAKTWLIPCLHDEPFARLAAIKHLFASVQGVLFNTEPEQQLARQLFDFDPARGAVVGMGLDPFEADADAFATRHGINYPYLLYSGRREPLKGTPVLLDFLAAFRARTGRDIRLVLTGSGQFDPPPDLAPYIRDIGFVSEQEKHEAMAGALAFVHPSLNESLGIVLLEAWLARTPALVRAQSAVLRWQCQASGGGLWFRHYPDFEEILSRLMDDPALRTQLATAGRTYVERTYHWPAVMQRLESALQ